MMYRLMICFILAAGPAVIGDRAWAGDSEQRTIRVEGRGEVNAVPDAAELHAAAVAVARSAQDAMADVSGNGRALMEAAGKHGVADKDIQTGSISLMPVFERRPRGEPSEAPKITGYRATLRYRVTVRDVKSFGKLLDALVKAGANDLSGIRFFVTEQEKLIDEARRRAVQDARRAAGVLAGSAGVKLGKAIGIEEIGGPSLPQPRGLAMRAESVPIAPGEVSARARVRVVFAIRD
ncbi:MAG: SIMPL domain-containing protein [Rhodospirillales bacterium]